MPAARLLCSWSSKRARGDGEDRRARQLLRRSRWRGCGGPARSRPWSASAGRPARGRKRPRAHSSSASSPPAAVSVVAPASSSCRARIWRLTELSSTTSTRPSSVAGRAAASRRTSAASGRLRGSLPDQHVAPPRARQAADRAGVAAASGSGTWPGPSCPATRMPTKPSVGAITTSAPASSR